MFISSKRTNSGAAAGGSQIGIPSLLFLLFTGLKLSGHIDWSWWWITAPIWGPAGVAFVVVVVCGLFQVWRSRQGG